MRLMIHPSTAHGSIQAPPSKSLAHRALICAALAGGTGVVRGIAPSEDLLATMDCLRALGADVRYHNGAAEVTGLDLQRVPDGAVLPCRASASTLRFLIPLALLSGKGITFTGERRLLFRPLTVYQDLCTKRALTFALDEQTLSVRGPLSAGDFSVPGNISSQFVSGLLFALPLLAGDSVIRLLPPVESRPYIDMTVAALREYGVNVSFSGQEILVPGNQRYFARDTAIEGDWSNGAFFLALNALGGQVEVSGLTADSTQGDRVCLSLFEDLRSGTPAVDLSDCPDLGPVCMVLAAALHGGTFTGIRRLRLKESDRCAAMARELAKFGVLATASENTMTIPASPLRRPVGPLESHGDHRIAMALSILATRTGGVIEGAEAVNKSMPDFFDRLRDLGIEVTEQ